MAIQGISLLLCLSAFFTLFALSAGDVPFNRTSFPSDFIFGVASSAYQYEGAAGVGGRGPSIWDTFTEKYPDKIKDGSNGIIALDSYNQYKEHVGLMKDLGFETYRFSISWSRILPRGKLSGGVNQEGITYYNNLIDELLSNGLLPFVTMFHWDVPQALEDEYGGFLDPRIVIDYRDYAELVFREFGDRVKHWITMNEPWVFINFGYVNGIMAPGRCSEWMARNCTGGDSSTEPYLVAHHILLAHAAAVKVYRDKYQTSQKGKIGITNYAHWVIPFSNSSSDIDAAKRALAFTLEWFLYPITFGQYPSEMADKVGKRLPEFSKEQSLMLKGSYDFLGLNYYTTFFAMDVPCTSDNNIDYYSDFCAVYSSNINGVSIGPQGATEWFYIYPEGLQDVLVYTKRKYNNPVIYITENGINEVNTGVMSLEDDIRVDFYHNHLTRVRNAIMEGVDVRGYFAWTLLDDFEWSDGYTTLFGLFYVDRNDGLKFYPRKSASWFKNFLLKGNF